MFLYFPSKNSHTPLVSFGSFLNFLGVWLMVSFSAFFLMHAHAPGKLTFAKTAE